MDAADDFTEPNMDRNLVGLLLLLLLLLALLVLLLGGLVDDVIEANADAVDGVTLM